MGERRALTFQGKTHLLYQLVMGRTMFEVRSSMFDRSMFDRSKPKIECSSAITNRGTRSSVFDVLKSDVRVSSMSNSINIVKAL